MCAEASMLTPSMSAGTGSPSSWRIVGATSRRSRSGPRPVRAVLRGEHVEALVGVVRVIGTGVVFENVHCPRPHLSDAPPEEVAKVDEEVGRDPVPLGIELLREMRHGADRASLIVAEGLELLLELAADALVVLRRHHTPWLATGYVEEQSAVVAALPPSGRSIPVDHLRLERGRPVGLVVQDEVTLPSSATR